MTLYLTVISVHFLLGAAGVYFNSRKLPQQERKAGWIKYVWYLIIFLIMAFAVMAGKPAFLAASVIIFSFSLFEIFSAFQKSAVQNKGILVLIVVSMTLIIGSYSSFFFLPRETILFVYSIVIIFDGASQLSGQITGKHQISPAIIPGKTWEGFAGGTLSAVITAGILHGMTGRRILPVLITGLIICMAAFTGDFLASALKRKLGIKDYGKILPGQGGFLDRFDSFLMAGAIYGLICIGTTAPLFVSSHDIIMYLVYSLGFLIILFGGEIMNSILKVKAEYCRIFSHVAAGIACLFLINAFDSSWYLTAFCLQSALFIRLTKKRGIFRSHHGIDRQTGGSSFFFLGILFSFLIADHFRNEYLFYLPVAVLTISDPLAALSGMKLSSGHLPLQNGGQESTKTYAGSAAFFVSALFILFTGFTAFVQIPLQRSILFAVIVSVIATVTEAYSSYGTDNISVPLVISLILIPLLNLWDRQ